MDKKNLVKLVGVVLVVGGVAFSQSILALSATAANSANIKTIVPLPSTQLDPHPEPPAPVGVEQTIDAKAVVNTETLTANKSIIDSQLNQQPGLTVSSSGNGADAGKLIMPVDRNKIDGQPETSAPELNAGAGKGNVKDKINDVNAILQLNPQPEPPLPSGEVETHLNSLDQKIKSDNLQLKRGEQGGGAQVMKLELNSAALGEQDLGTVMELVPSQNSIEARFRQGDREIMVSIKADVWSEGGKMMLQDGNTVVILRTPPAYFYSGLEAALVKKNLDKSAIKSIDLAIDNGKPVYNVELSEPVKLFGIIKMNINAKAIINADSNEVEAVNRSWYSFLMAKSGIENLELKANLRVESITFEPANFSEGQEVKAVMTVVNDGGLLAFDFPDIINGGGPTAKFYMNDQLYGWYYIALFIKPGESQKFDMTVKTKCGQELMGKIQVDSVNEPSKDDNSLKLKMNCQ